MKKTGFTLAAALLLLIPALGAQVEPAIIFGMNLRCDQGMASRADEIVDEVPVPLYQKHIDRGRMASYGFYPHRTGGLFRRLETIGGADHMTLMNMQGAVYGEAFENNPLTMQHFSDICRAHTDCMWANRTPGS